MKYLQSFILFEYNSNSNSNDKINSIQNTLPKTTALFKKVSINNDYNLVLFDIESEKLFGMINLSKNTNNNSYYVSAVASIKGYGALMYDFAAMSVDIDNAGISPSIDGDIRDGAWKVWKFYYKNRPDVRKETIPFEDDKYSFLIIDDYDEHEGLTLEEKKEWLKSLEEESNTHNPRETLDIFNTIFYLEPSKKYLELIEEGEEYDNDVLDEVIKEGDIFFDSKYSINENQPSYQNSPTGYYTSPVGYQVKYPELEEEIIDYSGTYYNSGVFIIDNNLENEFQELYGNFNSEKYDDIEDYITDCGDDETVIKELLPKGYHCYYNEEEDSFVISK